MDSIGYFPAAVSPVRQYNDVSIDMSEEHTKHFGIFMLDEDATYHST